MMKTTDEDVDWAVEALNQACRAQEAVVLLIDKSGALDEFDSSWKHTVVSNDEALYALRASIKKKRYEQAKPCKFTLNIKHKPYGRFFFVEDLHFESINVSIQEARGGNLTFPDFDKWVSECDSCLAASLKDPVREFIVETLRREGVTPFSKEATVAIPCSFGDLHEFLFRLTLDIC